MSAPLLSAVRDAQAWLPRFNRRDYVPAFAEYRARFGADLLSLLAREEDPAALAASLLDGLEESWQGLSPRRRREARAGTRQMLALYLSPLLLDLEDQPAGRRLAESIRGAWLARFPKEPYTVTDHAALRAGFRDAIMGIEVRWHG